MYYNIYVLYSNIYVVLIDSIYNMYILHFKHMCIVFSQNSLMEKKLKTWKDNSNELESIQRCQENQQEKEQ